MSDLERAQEWLNCWRETHDPDCCGGVCGEHPWSPWPCTRAQALARSLAEVRADALRDAADAWSDWDALSAPEDWLRDRADRISRDLATDDDWIDWTDEEQP